MKRQRNKQKPAANAKMSTAAASAKARSRRRIVEDSDEENEAEVNRLLRPPKRSEAETRPPAVGGRAAHNGIASAGSRGAATAAARKSVAVSDGGTSSGSEDTAWFRKPSSNAGVTVTAKRAKGMANPVGV